MTHCTAPEISAPAHWQRVDFLSDVHLHASQAHTAQAWRDYLAHTPCDALFILGDLFEMWVGDDVLTDATHGPFWRDCVQALHTASTRFPIFYMVGNRDFLAGDALLHAAGLTGISDPSVLNWGHDRWLLSHGDALCVADVDYQRFRAEVRQPGWQQAFLAQPLTQRLAIAHGMRQRSEQLKSTQTHWVDVDNAAALAWLDEQACSTLIHGHTHQPAQHALGNAHRRVVLSDWEADAHPPRLQVLSAQRSAQENGHASVPILHSISLMKSAVRAD